MNSNYQLKIAILGSVLLSMLTAIPAYAQISPNSVPGKEYSDFLDRDQNGVLSTEQTLLWRGDGTVTNGFNYGGREEVNAMANIYDAYFHEVINNSAHLLFSTTGDRPAPILYETPAGGRGIWATQPQINSRGVDDLDGLEVWGPEQIPDGNRYSLLGDNVTDGSGRRVAVFNDISLGGGFRSPAFYVDELASAINLDQSRWSEFDVDGLMTFGDEIMFSITPISNVFDGGEIWTWKKGDPTAQYLNHGGHLWNTDFDVMGTFGTASENVDALEAVVPEPSSVMGIIGLVAIGAISTLKRKHKTAKST